MRKPTIKRAVQQMCNKMLSYSPSMSVSWCKDKQNIDTLQTLEQKSVPMQIIKGMPP